MPTVSNLLPEVHPPLIQHLTISDWASQPPIKSAKPVVNPANVKVISVT